MCVSLISALHTFTSTFLFHHSILPWMSHRSKAGLTSHYHRQQKDMRTRCYIIHISMRLITSLPLIFSLSSWIFVFFFSPLHFTRLSHVHHMFKIALSLLPYHPSQQTVQAAGCSPWQRRPAVQWAANWWLVYKMKICVFCVCLGTLVRIYWIHKMLSDKYCTQERKLCSSSEALYWI